MLSELAPLTVQVYWGGLGVGVYDTPSDVQHHGRRIRSHGQSYPHGIMAHAPSFVDYQLDGHFRTFTTQVLAQDDVDCGDGMVFRVLLDGVEVYSSPPINANSDPVTVQLDVTATNALTLVVDDRHDADCDWAIWADPFLTGLDALAQSYPPPTIRPTPTVNPDMPCGEPTDEDVLVFLDCGDIRRIRREIVSNPETAAEWRLVQYGVDQFMEQLPPSYSPADDPAWMWLDFMPRNMGLVYLVTGDPNVGNAMEYLLRTVAEGTPAPVYEVGRPESGLMVQPGHFTSSHLSLLFAYATIRNTPRFTDDERAFFDDYFLEQAERLDGFTGWVDSLRGNIWNTYIQADAAIASIALTLPDDTRSRYLYNRGRQRLELRIARWYDAEGGWREYADNYSPLVLQALLLWAETEFHTRNDVYSHSFGGNTLHSICEWYLQVMTPEGVLPAIGDGHWLQSLDPGLLRLCAIRTADPSLGFAFEAYLAGRDRWPSQAFKLRYLFDTIAWSDSSLSIREPNSLSQFLPDSGLAVLRSSWAQDAQYILLEFMDDDLPFHMHIHQSFGNVVLYDGGSWILENGYRANSEEEYSRSQGTADHSTLTLDDETQTNTRASESFFAAPGTIAMASATSRTYPNLTHSRTVLWSESWHQWVVIDDAALYPPSGPHALQLRWYVSLPDAQHPLHVEHTEEHDTATWDFTRTWGSPGTLAIDLLPAIPASFIPISRVYIDPWEGRATGVEMEVSPTSWPVRLVSVLSCNLTGNVPVSSVLRTDSRTGTLVSSQRLDAQWDWVMPGVPSAHAQVGPYLVNGHAGCRETTGPVTASYCLLGGTRLAYAEVTLVNSPLPLSVHVDIAHSLAYIDAPDKLTVDLFWPSEVVEVTDEVGAPVEFSISGSVLQLHAQEGSHVYSILAPPE